MHVRRREGRGFVCAVLVAFLLIALGSPTSAVEFQPLQDLQTGIGFTTVLELGPEDPDPATPGDGCIYAVNGGEGAVHRVCFDDAKLITSSDVVIDINGGGGVNNALGITIDPASPPGEIHLYLGYSDSNGAPFNGKIARAVSIDGGATYTVDEDFVTGLSRSAFDHQTNGLDFGPDDCLYIAAGNNSNAGYDSAFAESRTSSAILRACFKDAAGGVDAAFDRNCGGGSVQEACDVEVYASGLRNPYDLVWHSNGELYNTDNDANPGFRDSCPNVANTFGCPCQQPAVSPTGDELNRIVQGAYYGSPNPYLANPAGLQCQGGSDAGDACTVDGDCNGGTCQDLSALCTDAVCGDPAHCYYFGQGEPPQAGEDPNGLYVEPINQSVASTLDGITEYRSQYAVAGEGSFCSDWNGQLLVTAGPGAVRRYSLSPDGLSATHEGTGNLNNATGLDVVTGPDGTIFVADLNGGKVTYLEPITQSDPASADYFVACAADEACVAGTCAPLVAGCANPPAGDSDCDGLPNTTDPCPADTLNRCAGTVATCGTGGAQECGAGSPLRLDLGTSAPQTDCNGDVWEADSGAGSTYNGNTAIVDATVEPAFGCVDAATTTIIASEVYADPLVRSYPIADGTYVVNLLFAEAFSGACAVGARTVDVSVEGSLVYGGPGVGDGFDPYATAELLHGTADACGGLVVRSAVTTITDGFLDITLDEDDAATGDANAALKAVEVIAIEECTLDTDCDDGLQCTTDTCSLGSCVNTTVTDGTTCDDGDPGTVNDICTAGVCAGVTDDGDNDGLLTGIDPCPGDPLNRCYGPVAIDQTTLGEVRINASTGQGCSGAKTDCNGDVWAADFGFNQGSSSSTGSAIAGVDTLFGCTDAATEDILQCERYDAAAAPELLYSFDLPDGDYLVNMLFANTFAGTAGAGLRVFDILIEGGLVYDDFDQFVEAGGDLIAISRSAIVSVADGDGLQIELLHVTENPAIKGIEVLAAGTTGGCILDADCDDGNDCTQDTCVMGSCVNDSAPLDGTQCDDGVFCTFQDTCSGGECQPGIPDAQQCDDGNICTSDTCDLVLDCVSTPVADGTTCDDGLGCTDLDQCTAGSCGGTDNCPTGAFCSTDTGVCETVSTGEAFIALTPGGGINASTYSNGTMQVTNTSPVGGPTIDLVRFDLSTSFLRDIVFDPADGTAAGDETNKCLQIDSGGAATGYAAPADPCVDPFSQPRENGYDQMVLFFDPGTFEPGETITFSVDIDPTSIQGAAGAGGAGSVSGFELTGATVTVKFDDGLTIVSSPFREPASDGGGQNIFKADAPLPPTVELLGVTSPATVTDPNQTARIGGTPGADVRLLVVEGALDNGLFDIEPFEANTAVAIQEFSATIGAGGTVDVPVVLTDTAVDGGINHVMAATVDGDGSGRTSALSNVVIAELGTPTQDGVLFRVNGGGPLVAATDAGIDWDEDSSTTPSPYHNGGTNTTGFAVATVDGSVPTSTPIDVFQSERWDPATGDEMAWSFPVTPGSYEVRLYFANGCTCTQNPGERVFDVAIEGSLVLDDYDIVADVGHLVGTMKSFIVTADSSLDIDFVHVVENPLINAIEILAADPNGYLSAAPSAIDFGLTEIATTSTPTTVTLTNLGLTGDADITLTNVTVSGEFTHDLVLQTIAPGATATFDVAFAPTAVGPQSGSLTIEHDGVNSPVVISLDGEGYDPAAAPISFASSGLTGESSGNPTSLDFGPDDRLYVAQQNGTIYAYTIQRNGPTDYVVTDTEVITQVQSIPNHDDDGTPSGQANRQVTGLLATGTPTNPVLYVTSSDPRIGAGGGGNDLNLDTNSGIISRLTWNGSAWEMVHLVRGLPRSEENHSTNGMTLDAATNTLYVMSGGHTNKGAPSNNFAQTQEYALSAALLSVDLSVIESLTPQVDGEGQTFLYDLPTLDDPTRGTPGNPDPGDPFGGNDGRNQARIVPGGPVQVYSPGYRNAYDVVMTEAGNLYTFDNGPNTGWGGIPVGEGTATCTNETNEATSTGYGDGLHYISGPGYYGGHPHPTRANPEGSGLFVYENQGGTWVLTESYDWQLDFGTAPPVPFGTGNAIECDYQIPGVEDQALAVVNASTNGITEYVATNFGGAMQGDLLAASFNGNIYRYQLNAAGDGLAAPGEALFSGFGSQPLDVIAQGDDEIFPGTVWAATYGADTIVVFEPIDFGNCTGADDPALDEDGDGYDNADEIANGTDPCNGGSKPNDQDGDFTSDLLDDDDDNDGILDPVDEFAIDPQNGLATTLPIAYPLFNADPGTGFFGLGFTGLMINGTTDWLDQFDENILAAGGAAGLFTVEAVSAGDAYQAGNDQDNGFQFGVDVDTTTALFSVKARVLGPFFTVNGEPSPPTDFQSLGIQIGAGDQDNYLKFVINANGGAGGVQVLLETTGTATGTTYGPTTVGDVLNAIFVDLYLEIDPALATVQPYISLDGAPLVAVGPTVNVPAGWFDGADAKGLAVGVIATSAGSGTPFTATWDLIELTPGPAGAECAVDVDCDDGNSCTADTCDLDNLCVNDPVPAGATCDGDADLCTIDECDGAGGCVNVGVVSCDTGEVCNPGTGTCEPSTEDLDDDGILDGFDPCLDDARNLCFGPVAVDGTTLTAIRMNASDPAQACGGERVDCNGDTWVADFGFAGSDGTFACNLANGCPIANLDATIGAGCAGDLNTEDIFQCERYGAALGYSFDVPDGQYVVNLLFANAWTGSVDPGTRVFDIVIEGATVYAAFDQIVAAGGQSGYAIVRSAVVDVLDGNGLQIDFGMITQNPAIKGIEVLAAATPECTLDADCDDLNDCTTDTCNAGICDNAPLMAGATCEFDGDLCTIDECDGAGSCLVAGLVTCDPGATCDPGTGVCFECTIDADCDDGDTCTTDTCNAGTCENTADVCDASGQVYYYRNATGEEPGDGGFTAVGVADVPVTLSGSASDSTTTDVAGAYLLPGIFGDVSLAAGPVLDTANDNAVTSFDAAQIAQDVVGLVTLSANQALAGDVTGNGGLSSLDAAYVAQYAVALREPFGSTNAAAVHFPAAETAGSDWAFVPASIDLTGVGSSVTGDFAAVLLGDVTGNWQAGGARAPSQAETGGELLAAIEDKAARLTRASLGTPVPLERVAGTPASVSIERIERAGRDGRWIVRLALENAVGIRALDGALRLDGIELTDVRPVEAGGSFNVVHHTEAGVARFAMWSAEGIVADGAVVELELVARRDALRDLSTALELEADEGGAPLAWSDDRPVERPTPRRQSGHTSVRGR